MPACRCCRRRRPARRRCCAWTRPACACAARASSWKAWTRGCRPKPSACEYGAEQGLGDSHVEIDGAQLQFGGTRLGWQIDSGQLGLARLRLDILQRTLELDQLALQLKGSERRHHARLHELALAALKVQGDTLQGGALEGQLTLGGDQRLQLQVRSQPPSGAFERITVPGLQLDIDGQLGRARSRARPTRRWCWSPNRWRCAWTRCRCGCASTTPGCRRCSWRWTARRS